MTAAKSLGDDDTYTAKAVRYRRLNDEYDEFTKAAGLRSQKERGNIPEFGTKEGEEAEKTASKVTSMAVLSNGNDWTNAVAIGVSQEEIADIKQYAADRGINIKSLKDFDGDTALLKSELDTIYKMMNDFPTGKKMTVSVSKQMSPDDFASTTNSTITFNNLSLRSREATE